MPSTYNDLYIELRRVLRARNIEAYSLEARLILAAAAGKTVDELIRDLRLYTSEETRNNLLELIKRRLRGEPVAYLVGSWEFYSLPFVVTPDVLIPRIDTEVLVDAALQELRGSASARVLDLCCGSGCVGCAIAHEMPETRVVLLDYSEKVLDIARENVRLLGLSDRVSTIQADVRSSPPHRLGSFDMVLCNPPYIPSAEIDRLDVSVRGYEPRGALDGGGDGLEFYRAVLSGWSGVLRKPGKLFFELGEGQAEDVGRLMRLNGFRGIETVRDTLGIERVVYGRRA